MSANDTLTAPGDAEPPEASDKQAPSDDSQNQESAHATARPEDLAPALLAHPTSEDNAPRLPDGDAREGEGEPSPSPRATASLYPTPSERRTHQHGARLFFGLLGLAALGATVSLWWQLEGLVGSAGISPAAQFLETVRARVGPGVLLWRYPNHLWLWGASDAALHALCALGCLLAALIMFARPRISVLLGFWSVYLSLHLACGPFLAFQWDLLLLETALAACLLVPPRPRRASGTAPPQEPSAVGRWVLGFVLFKLMLLSGATKLMAADDAWRTLTALEFHFFTQPLPTPLGYWAHHAPTWLKAAGTAVTLAIELAAPWMLLWRGRPRHLAAASVAILMGLIALTGNFGFFNLLTLALCAVMMDDAVYERLSPRLFRPSPAFAPAPAPVEPSRARLYAALGLICLGGMVMGARLMPERPLHGVARALLASTAPFRISNGYGLFASMTRTRPEIEVEASLDGVHWQPYRFRYKPHQGQGAGVWLPMYMPRLDWQMWFAALQGCRNDWFIEFQGRLLEASPPVLALLAHDPMGGQRPRYVRSTLFLYSWRAPGERSNGQGPWVAERLGPHCPVLTLENGLLRAVEEEGRGLQPDATPPIPGDSEAPTAPTDPAAPMAPETAESSQSPRGSAPDVVPGANEEPPSGGASDAHP